MVLLMKRIKVVKLENAYAVCGIFHHQHNLLQINSLEMGCKKTVAPASKFPCPSCKHCGNNHNLADCYLVDWQTFI